MGFRDGRAGEASLARGLVCSEICIEGKGQSQNQVSDSFSTSKVSSKSFFLPLSFLLFNLLPPEDLTEKSPGELIDIVALKLKLIFCHIYSHKKNLLLHIYLFASFLLCACAHEWRSEDRVQGWVLLVRRGLSVSSFCFC